MKRFECKKLRCEIFFNLIKNKGETAVREKISLICYQLDKIDSLVTEAIAVLAKFLQNSWNNKFCCLI